MVDSAGGAEFTVTLKCADDERLVIGSVHLEGCELIQSLPSLPEEVSVPFLEDEISDWYRYCVDGRPLRGVGFLECVAIMKVADFLQDQGMLEAAAKSANYTLIRPSRPGKASSLHPKDVFNSFVDALQSMPAHLSQAVLSAEPLNRIRGALDGFLNRELSKRHCLGTAGGQLQDWMRVLPPSCLPIMVPAAVTSGTLRLHPDEQGIEHLEPIFSIAKDLHTFYDLELVFRPPRSSTGSRHKTVDQVTVMTQLKGLAMWNVDPPDIPTLAALTHLRMDNSAGIHPLATFTADISALTALKDLAILSMMIPSVESFSLQLRNLTVLTSLELRSIMCVPHHSSIDTDMPKMLASSIAACCALESLTLEVPVTVRWTYHKTSIEPHLPQMMMNPPPVPKVNSSIFKHLSNLPHLSSLRFRVPIGWPDANPSGLPTLWSAMTALRRLTFESQHVLGRFLPSLKHLPALEHFQLDCKTAAGAPLMYHPSSDIHSWFPTTLTSLKFYCGASVLPDLGTLPHLQTVELGGCSLWCQGAVPPSISQLTGLKTFSTGVPLRGQIPFRDLVNPHFEHTPELDLEMLVGALPKTLCEFRMPQHCPTERVVATIGTLFNLEYLDLGRVPHSRVMLAMVCGLVPSQFRALRWLRIRWQPGAVRYQYASILMRGLNLLHCFEELDHGPDPERFWNPKDIKNLKFRLVSDSENPCWHFWGYAAVGSRMCATLSPVS